MDRRTYQEYLRTKEPLLRILGNHPPFPQEAESAQADERDAPRGTEPIAAARYFEALQELNDDGDAYNGEWPVRANPVIVHFFMATKTTPAGDVTPWCAAFANYCLQLSGKAGTR